MMDGPRDGLTPALERAMASLEEDRAPAPLRVRVALIRVMGRRRQHRRGAPALAAAALALVLAIPLVLVGGGVGGAVSVAEAVALGARPPVAAVHEPPDGRVTLPRVSAAGLSFPYWEDRFGWRAIGFRRDRLDGRTLTTVVYVQAHHRLAYTIVSGPALATPAAARSTLEDGTRLTALDEAGRRVVTWLRRGHTCVLSGAGVSQAELLALGAWRGGGAIPY
jgi:hypothetical protein